VRVFEGRDSMGVRSITLAEADHVISLAILRHVQASAEERTAYLKMRRAVAGEAHGDADTGETEDPELEPDEGEGEDGSEGAPAQLSPERYGELGAAEQIILTVSQNGYGKRTSSYEYRVAGRGGKGIVAMAVNVRNGDLVASFPVEHGDEIMLVTNGGQLIRCPVEGIRVAGRATQGVIVFDTADDEHVMSVERLSDPEAEEAPDDNP
jgi:DNA gyrase subunit A